MKRTELLTTSRLEAFSDGVIAFAATLMVLGVAVPHLSAPDSGRELATLLREQVPNFFIYGVSFATLTVWWLSHHHLFHRIKKTDRWLLLLNSAFLFFITFLPFPTNLVGQYPSNPAAAALYGIVGGLTGACLLGIRFYAMRHGALFDSETNLDDQRHSLRRGMLSLLAYLFGAALGCYHPHAALAIYAAIAIYYVFPSRRRRSEGPLPA